MAGLDHRLGNSIRRTLLVKLYHIGDCITALKATRRLKTPLAGRMSCGAARWRVEGGPGAGDGDALIKIDFFNPRSEAETVERTEEDRENCASASGNGQSKILIRTVRVKPGRLLSQK